MNEEEAKYKLLKYCDREIDNSGWWLFGKKKLTIEYTALLETWRKNANLPLPDNITFPGFSINSAGIDLGSSRFSWDEIAATAFKIEIIADNSAERYLELRHLLFCSHNGEIFDRQLGTTDHFKGLLGHFIESYKQEYATRHP
jgi:hypothetical protein